MDFARRNGLSGRIFRPTCSSSWASSFLMGMLVDEKYGGAGARFVSYVAAMEELGAADQSVASG
jgi:alkylation response protein AidB-like acyl-CoA dehydrogenase